MCDKKEKFTTEEKLKRFLYLCSFTNKFVTGNVDKYSFFIQDLQPITTAAKNKEKFKEILLSVNKDPWLPRRQSLFFTLAAGLAYTVEGLTKEDRHEICKIALDLCENDEEFFTFVKYFTVLIRKNSGNSKKFPTILKKIVAEFYRKKTPYEIAKSYARAKSYHSWKHKDLIKLGHYKSETRLKDFVVQSILFDLKNLKGQSFEDDEEKKEIVECLTLANNWRETACEKTASELILANKLPFDQINTVLMKSSLVWTALLTHAPLRQILQFLPKLYKMGFIKINSPDHNRHIEEKIVSALSSPERVKESGIHPLEVFIYQKNFEKGGRPMDPQFAQYLKNRAKENENETAGQSKLEKAEIKKKQSDAPRCTAIMNALHKCLNASYRNFQPTGKRFLFTFDATAKGQSECLHNKNITALEASYALTYSFYKLERSVNVAVFDGPKINLFELPEDPRFTYFQQKMAEFEKCKCISPLPPIEWALKKSIHIDVFINFIHFPGILSEASKEVREKFDRKLKIFDDYCRSLNLPNAKIINICFPSKHMSIFDEHRNVIDIAGLSGEIPHLIYAFIKGNFV